MKWKTLKKSEAEAAFEEFYGGRDEENGFPEVSAEGEYAEMRGYLVQAYQEVRRELEEESGEKSIQNRNYQIDLRFGIRLYRLLTRNYGMNVRVASTPGVWRYLGLRVIPDLVADRWSDGLHPDRFWKKDARLWLRVLWWYIHLSWQGSEAETLETLRNNNTDHVLQLVDRAGRDGFRVSLYRELMKQYGKLSAEERKGDIFRKAMVLNTARVQVLEPELCEGGAAGYVRTLFSDLKPRAAQPPEGGSA